MFAMWVNEREAVYSCYESNDVFAIDNGKVSYPSHVYNLVV